MFLKYKLFVSVCAVLMFVTLPWVGDSSAGSMQYVNRYSGDEKLRFTAGGRALTPEGAKLRYRVINDAAGWKRIWGHLYDDSLAVDFQQHSVLAIYRSPANGMFSIRPSRVELNEDRLTVHVDVTWNGRDEPSHPFLFLVLPGFKSVFADESFHGPSGRDLRLP